eukprot:NODE_159_length_16647_cov_0.251390.p2 type:complete len:647 gc:universal NODE_159_length_16647_cov_0.251390:16453-14513(-)
MQNNSLDHVDSVPIHVVKYLDAGSFSQVFLCQTPSSMAVLKITSSPEHMVSIAKELNILSALKKTNSDYLQSFIVGFIAGEVNQYRACLLLEYCKMNLVQYMNTLLPNHIPLTSVLHAVYDVIQGLYFLHSLNIIHRDIKLENVLLKEQQRNSNTYTPQFCLCDFGSCSTQIIPYNTIPTNIEDIKVDIDQHTTLQYRSPELIDLHLKRGISTKVDIWAIGCLLYKLLYYTNPFDTEYAILSYSNNISQLLLQTNKSISGEVKTLLEKCLWVDPLERWDAYQVLNHLCQIKGSPCPLQNIFIKEQASKQSVTTGNTNSHPLNKLANNQGLKLQPVQMSDLAHQRRKSRNRLGPDSNSELFGEVNMPNNASIQAPIASTQFPAIDQLETKNTVVASNLSHFPTLDQFEGNIDIPAPSITSTFEKTAVDIDSQQTYLQPVSNQVSQEPHLKASLKLSSVVDEPSVLFNNIIKSIDLQDLGILLKWSWQRFHVKDDPIAMLLIEIRRMTSQIGITTTNTRSVFRGCLVLHSLLLYGPSSVVSQSNLENVLQSLESVQNRMSSFYARYLREYIAFLSKHHSNGRYKTTRENKINFVKFITAHIQIHSDKFINMMNEMGANVDIALCVYLYVQDVLVALSTGKEYALSGIL